MKRAFWKNWIGIAYQTILGYHMEKMKILLYLLKLEYLRDLLLEKYYSSRDKAQFNTNNHKRRKDSQGIEKIRNCKDKNLKQN